MSLIEATSGTYRSRVDGTIVLSVEIEPRFRAEALALLGMPGTPVVLAAFKTGAAAKKAQDKPKPEPIGEVCFRAVTLCQEPEFWRWLHFASMTGANPQSESEAAALVKRACQVESRREFDIDDAARERFRTLIEEPYRQWQRSLKVVR